ncbi:MAG: alpha/beta hydrolase [Rhodospirillaceae bacterium]|nr:alpha/beta hydrolase [Rhodospirillaceae bacterium]
MKFVIGVLVAAVLAVGGYAGLLEYGAFDMPLKDLEAKYAKPTSKFMDIDGVRVHYMDEGPQDPAAPAIVLLHASYMNLLTWDSMAKALSSQYRVVRFDMPTNGLTGVDPKQRYSIEFNMQILDELTTKLGIQKFALLGTSSGGPVAFRYAAEKPERVTRMILINSAGMPRTAQTNPNRQRGTTIDQWIKDRHRSMTYWRENLAVNVTSMPPPDWLVEMAYDMGRRAGLRDEAALFLKNFKTGDPEAVLAQVKAPTMILWGMSNPTVMHLEANIISLWLTQAPSLVKKYPKVGHYLYLEIPSEVEKDVLDFLSGAKDGDLRITQRVPVASAAKTP